MIDVRIAGGDGGDGAARTAPDEREPHAMRVAGGVLGRSLTRSTSVDCNGIGGELLTAFVEGLVLGGHRTRRAPRVQVTLRGVADEEAVARAIANADATLWARELANTPAATKTPEWLARQAARRLQPLGVRVAIRDEAWLRTNRFGGVLAVGGGSSAPPRLIHATWGPRGAAPGDHVVLVGKGITFDTGGINLKTGAGMRLMHTDMSGGAAVLAALGAVAERRLPVRVTALVPAAENALGAGSFRPGDVVRHVNGRTSEIVNTDAEGRLVLADALAYAVARLDPSVLVDVATLTGAMKVALGLRTAGLFAKGDALARELLRAGDAAGEPVWRMPLHADYVPTLSSGIADANNAPGNPGAITAALFLKPFTGEVPWAHLDIAGPARAPADDGMVTKGATGFGARLLTRWVEARTG